MPSSRALLRSPARMSSIATLFVLLLLAAGVLVWQLLRGMHERALSVALQSCREAALQLLDATVALQQLRWTHENGRWGWRLDYGFEVSTDGQQRRSGRIRFHGGALAFVEMPRPAGQPELWVLPRE